MLDYSFNRRTNNQVNIARFRSIYNHFQSLFVVNVQQYDQITDFRIESIKKYVINGEQQEDVEGK